MALSLIFIVTDILKKRLKMFMDSCQNCKNTYFCIDAIIRFRKVPMNLQ